MRVGERRGGRQRRGNREQVSARVPVEHKALYAERAAALGITLTDYFALVMARAHDLADPDYIRLPDPDAGQRELPLSA